MTAPSFPRGIYVITDSRSGDRLVADVRRALEGGADAVQYRDKGGTLDQRLRESRRLHEACREYSVPLIVNDDVELAAAIGAEGVHLGEDDDDPNDARARLGPTAIIGVSCYNSLERAARAADAGADYLAFGSFFDSPTKPAARRADAGLLRSARERFDLPLIAIGGITAANAGSLIEAGAHAVAVISAVFGAEDPAEAVRGLRRAIGRDA